MTTHAVKATSPNAVKYGNLSVDGLNIAYREAADPASPKLVLLHGFPASSHQYRNLIPALADSEGGEAHLNDLPHAEMHRLDSGHFAVEDCLAEISSNMHRLYREKVAPQGVEKSIR